MYIVHCPKNNLNLFKVVTHADGWSGCNGTFLVFVPSKFAQKPDIYRCICSIRDRLNYYAEILNSDYFWDSVGSL